MAIQDPLTVQFTSVNLIFHVIMEIDCNMFIAIHLLSYRNIQSQSSQDMNTDMIENMLKEKVWLLFTFVYNLQYIPNIMAAFLLNNN